MNKKKSHNSEKIVKREKLFDERGKFKKGHPKVGGKEKGNKSFTTKVKEALIKIAEGKNYSYEEALVKTILKKGIVDGDSAIIKLIWNYLDGMPIQIQKNELTGADGGAIQIAGNSIKIEKYNGDSGKTNSE